MAARYPKGTTKHLGVQVSIPVHKSLASLAKDREITQDLLLRRLCEWVAGKTSAELIGLGVNLPIFANDDKRPTPAQDVELPE